MSAPQKYSREAFLKVFPSLVEDIKQSATRYNLPQNALDWLEKVGMCTSVDYGSNKI
jgi:hypothetical protein